MEKIDDLWTCKILEKLTKREVILKDTLKLILKEYFIPAANVEKYSGAPCH